MSDDRPIYEVLEFIGAKAYNCLRREDIHTVGQLLACTEADLLAIRTFGPGMLDLVVQGLAQHGLVLAGEGPPRNRAEQLADIALRKAHMDQWRGLVKNMEEAWYGEAVRQASMPSEPDVDIEVEDVAARRTYFMVATRRIHADGGVCADEKCPEPCWWHTSCSCGWSVRDVSKVEVKMARLDHGREHSGVGQSAW